MLVESAESTFWHPAYDWGWGMMAMHGFGWILILIVVVVLIMVFSRGFIGPVGSAETPPARRSALEILEERYARGEIDRDEYLEKRKDLH